MEGPKKREKEIWQSQTSLIMKLSPSKDFLYSLSTLSYNNIEPDVAFSLCLLVIDIHLTEDWKFREVGIQGRYWLKWMLRNTWSGRVKYKIESGAEMSEIRKNNGWNRNGGLENGSLEKVKIQEMAMANICSLSTQRLSQTTNAHLRQ